VTAEQPAPDWGPTWRDDPDALDRLCDYGAEQLYGPADRPTQTITPDRRYL
jgi:hypothetical protein